MKFLFSIQAILQVHALGHDYMRNIVPFGQLKVKLRGDQV